MFSRFCNAAANIYGLLSGVSSRTSSQLFTMESLSGLKQVTVMSAVPSVMSALKQ